MPIGKLRKRAEFQAARKGRRAETPAFTLQAAERRDEPDPSPAKVGLTVTKKVGSAPERNRIKRRLRALVREAGPACDLRPRTSYVLFARREALAHPFAELARDLARAVAAAHMPRKARADVRDKAGSPDSGASEPNAPRSNALKSNASNKSNAPKSNVP